MLTLHSHHHGSSSRLGLRSSLLALLITMGCLFPGLSFAHKLKVFAWVSGDTVTVESSFSGGRTLVRGMVDVQDAGTGATLFQGQTDEQGVFSFSWRETVKVPGTTLRIMVSGGDGHQNDWLLKPEEYQPPSGKTSPDTASVPQPDKQEPSAPAITPPRESPPTTSQLPAVSREELTNLLDERLEAKLAPLRRSLAQAEERGSQFTDILGGMGYIFGIAGIIAWMKRKK